jgi:Fe-S oxidoreductase
MKRKQVRINDISKNRGEPMVTLDCADLLPLPGEEPQAGKPAVKPLTDSQKSNYECSLDGVSALTLPRPQTKEEEDKLVRSFLNGLEKLLSRDDNWTFLQPLALSLDYCAKCLACSEECPVYVASGRQEIYRPNYRSEVLRRIVKKYLHGNKLSRAVSQFTDGDIELNWPLIARLAELSYRCNLCRRCTQACIRGVDNGLITHEIRKLLSQEMDIAPKELHRLGSIQQLKTGASTGVNPRAFQGMVEFMEEEIVEKTGRKIKMPVDTEGADILLIHNSGEFMSWPENPEAFAIIFDAAGLDWTLSSELGGYEATNYGVWYDDVQFARIASKQIAVANRLKVKKIVVGECGHAHKALTVIADRLLTEENYIPRESALPLLADLVCNGKLDLDPSRNDFPVTLHDSCNIVRLMGIVEPQRRILRQICPQFREMEPHGVNNYCCGGGSGFAVMSPTNFADWKMTVAGRMKYKQIIEAFSDLPGPATKKYVCAPCSNCKGQIRDLLAYYKAWDKYGIKYGGLAELIVNAMPGMKVPFINWDEEM